jgi:transposase
MSKNRNHGRGAGERKVTEEIFEKLDIVHPNAAGIDIGAETHYVSVPEDRANPSVRTFACFTADLEEMAIWLRECRITHVVMESTGVYWTPAYQVLSSHGLDVQLVDAHHAKNVPGRKTDVWDCRWLRKLHTFGLLRGCFIPASDVQEVRAYWRHRATLVESCSQHTLRIHKSLEQMNLQLHKALSDVMGVSGLRILRAIVAGERDAQRLAAMCEPGVKATPETVLKALTGNWRPECLFTLKQALDSYDFLHSQMQECDARIKECLHRFEDKNPGSGQPPLPPEDRRITRRKNEPYIDLRPEIARIFGVDLTRIKGISTITAMVLLSECGPDLSAFPTQGHFCSWLAVCPNPRITGGRVHGSRTRRVNNRLADALRVAAQSLHRSNCAMGAYLRRMAARHGMPKAITATAHKLAKLIYLMVTRGEAFVEQGQAAYEQQYQDRQLRQLQNRARSHGFTLVATATGEVVS